MLTYTPQFWHAVERKLAGTPRRCVECSLDHDPKHGIYVRACLTGRPNGEARPEFVVWGCTRCYPPPREQHYNPKHAANLTLDLFPPTGKG